MAKKEKLTFSHREIVVALNNAVLLAKAPEPGVIPDARLAKLRAYATAVVKPLREHLETEALRPEELVLILSTAALLVQMFDAPVAPAPEPQLTLAGKHFVALLFENEKGETTDAGPEETTEDEDAPAGGDSSV